MKSTLVLLALAGQAAAQPVTRPERDCRVTIALAPADVRAEIEAWVSSEPRCEHELEVRVVPTKGGYYLSARDERGRVRERVVPDAQSAAVLVVSWMADDSLGPVFPTPVEREHGPVIVETAPIVDEPVSLVGAPSLRRGFRIERAERAQRWFSVGAAGSSADRMGVRGQVDLLAGRAWSLAVAGGWRAGEHGPDVGQARVLVGTQRAFGRWSLRAQLGVGADLVEEGRDRMPVGGERSSVIGKAEAGVLAGLRLDRSWGLIGGPLVESSPELRPTLSVYLGLVRGL